MTLAHLVADHAELVPMAAAGGSFLAHLVVGLFRGAKAELDAIRALVREELKPLTDRVARLERSLNHG